MLEESAGPDEVHRAVLTLVVAGGYNGNRLGTVELLRSFSSRSATWQRAAASLPFRISSASVSSVGKDPFLSGGSGACSGGNYCAGEFHQPGPARHICAVQSLTSSTVLGRSGSKSS